MRNILLGVFMLLLHTTAFAQRTQIYQAAEERLAQGKMLYEKERYVAAKRQFEQVIEQTFPPSELEREQQQYREARFYKALSTAQLRQKDSDFELLTFIEDFPEALELVEAKFYLGQFYFISRKYREVIQVLTTLDPALLRLQQSAASHYYLGYSHFVNKEYKAARAEFSQISGLKNEYHYPANYYLGLIHYEEGDGQEALNYFDKLKDSKNYGRIIPYYVSKLLFELGRYDEMLAYATPLSVNKEVKQLSSINYLIAQAYFKQGEFVKAIPYLKRYQEQGGVLVSEDYYQLGYAAYISKDYKEAAKNLSKTASRQDSVGQSATFILGDCYLRMGQKEQALSSFYAASKLNADLDIQETAAFNHAKLGYELNIHPQSLTWLKDFVRNYPRSKYGDEAREHLGNLLLSTKNFKEAVEVIEGIKERNLAINQSYQKVTYYRGIELFNQGVYDAAVVHFDKSLTQSIDRNIIAQANFWKGESFFRLNQLQKSIESYQKFVQAYPVTEDLGPENSLIAAHYGMGYAYFKQNDYVAAISQFESAYNGILNGDKAIQYHQFITSIFGDLMLRLGDAHFAINAYPQAIVYYQNVGERKLIGADYAKYQEAILYGLTNKREQKISSLQTLVQRFPNSLYLDNAMLELANTFFIGNEYNKAIQQIDTLLTRRPNSLLVKNALLIRALVYFNQEKFDESLADYKQVVARFPKTRESRDALAGIKNIYIQLNQVETYLQYTSGIPTATVTLSEQDSIIFQAAELVYNQNNCEKAVQEFTKYVNRFPDGYFAVNARYLRSDCYARDQKYDLMLQDLMFIAEQARNIYSERTFARLSKYHYEQQNYGEALTYYTKLEQNSDSRWNILDAYQGLMRVNFQLENWSEANRYAQKLIAFEHTPELGKLEAQLVEARLLLQADSLSEALMKFTGIYEQSKSEYGAAAKYYLAEIQFKRKEYALAQNTIFELIDKIPYYDEWIGRAFLLLAETYVALGEDFQAIATLQSIVDNRKMDDLTRKAMVRLEELRAAQVKKRGEEKAVVPDSTEPGDFPNQNGDDPTGNSEGQDNLKQDESEEEGQNND